MSEFEDRVEDERVIRLFTSPALSILAYRKKDALVDGTPHYAGAMVSIAAPFYITTAFHLMLKEEGLLALKEMLEGVKAFKYRRLSSHDVEFNAIRYNLMREEDDPATLLEPTWVKDVSAQYKVVIRFAHKKYNKKSRLVLSLSVRNVNCENEMLRETVELFENEVFSKNKHDKFCVTGDSGRYDLEQAFSRLLHNSSYTDVKYAKSRKVLWKMRKKIMKQQ